MIKHFRRLRILLLLAVLAGCPAPGGPPAPPAELPSVVTFPQSVEIDVSTISSSGESSGTSLSALKSQVGSDGKFSDAIAIGSVTFSVFNQLLEVLLTPLNSLEIPVDPAITTFEGVIDVPGVFPQRVKVDFSDFDLDGDLITEGCTGCTCPAGCFLESCPPEVPSDELRPVCYRLWLENPETGIFERFMAGFFDVLAVRDDPETPEDEENPGAGEFRFDSTTPGNSLLFGVLYNHKNFLKPIDLTTEIFVQDRTFDSEENQTLFDNFHVFVSQEDPFGFENPEFLEKTINLNFEETPPQGEDPFNVQYLGRFREDSDFWSGTVFIQRLFEGETETVDFENVCARISTGNATARANCLDLGIDVGGESFVDPATESDVVFSDDFPVLPTF